MNRLVALPAVILCAMFSGAAGDISEDKKQNWIAVTEQSVRASLKDGDSATFRNAYFVLYREIPLVCGEVNSKNGFGGYSGYQHFIGGGDTHYMEESFAPGEFPGMWNKICVSGGKGHKRR
jgi:hypothetical protein